MNIHVCTIGDAQIRIFDGTELAIFQAGVTVAMTPANWLRLASLNNPKTEPLTSNELPSWDACADKRNSGQSLTALEEFIFDNEPVRNSRCSTEWEDFRTQLLAVLIEQRTAAETDERYQTIMRCAAIAERVCREHADPTAGYAAATAIRRLANATPLPSEEVSEMTGHSCDDGLRTAPCPGCVGTGCDYCNEGVQLRPALKAGAPQSEKIEFRDEQGRRCTKWETKE
jgi:hypothetical protein